MSISVPQIINGVYLLNPKTDAVQLSNTVSMCLCKAEALALIAATTDFEAFDSKIINNYMWAISDLIRETKMLYEVSKAGISNE